MDDTNCRACGASAERAALGKYSRESPLRQTFVGASAAVISRRYPQYCILLIPDKSCLKLTIKGQRVINGRNWYF